MKTLPSGAKKVHQRISFQEFDALINEAFFTNPSLISLLATGARFILSVSPFALVVFASRALFKPLDISNKLNQSGPIRPLPLTPVSPLPLIESGAKCQHFLVVDLRSLSCPQIKPPGVIMGISKTEVNLRRLLAAAPNQQNQTKLIHYITTSRELLEQLSTEISSEGISSVSKAKLNEYSEAIEALATKLASTPSVPVEDANKVEEISVEETKVESVTLTKEQVSNSNVTSFSGLRRRTTMNQEVGENVHDSKERGTGSPIRLDAEAQAHIEKHRKLQEDLTDEMVGLARQLKESSLVMSQSMQDTGKILDSTERAVEHSLASTGRANVRAMEVYSKTSKTTCFTCLLMFLMTCIFVMVVLLIRVT